MPNKIFKSLFFIVITASLSFGSVLANAEVGSDAAAKMKVERCFNQNHVDRNSKQIPADVSEKITACIFQGKLDNQSKNALRTSSNKAALDLGECDRLESEIKRLAPLDTQAKIERYFVLGQQYIDLGCN